MKTIDRAEAIQKVMEARNALDLVLQILLPEELEDGCPHPAESVQDLSTMDEGGELYRCTKCGADSKVPFPSIITED